MIYGRLSTMSWWMCCALLGIWCRRAERDDGKLRKDGTAVTHKLNEHPPDKQKEDMDMQDLSTPNV